MPVRNSLPNLKAVRDIFGEQLQENVAMSNYTTARVGGKAGGLLIAHSAQDLETIASQLWDLETPFTIIGSGSNVLVGDGGFNGIVVINRAKTVKVDARSEIPTVWAESGANLGGIARQIALRGLGGLEWAATIPGTIGGAVYGNAGAHGSDMHGCLVLAEILHPKNGKEIWSNERLAFAYRSSTLKRNPEGAVILYAKLQLFRSAVEAVQSRMEAFAVQRHASQPTGASLGSMFKNPPGDYAGRLIEAAGLKGTRIGGAEISSIHANFFVNHESASAEDIGQLIQVVQETVLDKFGVQLELEVELMGSWPDGKMKHGQNSVFKGQSNSKVTG